MRPIDSIFIHCSDSDFGDADLVRSWHTDPPPLGRGWNDIGYHFVILNGRPTSKTPYSVERDGIVEPGRPLETPGAHCKGHNKASIGICLIGKNHFTAKQLVVALPILIQNLRAEFPAIQNIYGHRQFEAGKSCPNFDVPVFLEALKL